MQICCPSCGYRREMSDHRLPEGIVVATCPQCHARFRFSRRDGVLGEAEPRARAGARPRATRLGDLGEESGASAPARSGPDPAPGAGDAGSASSRPAPEGDRTPSPEDVIPGGGKDPGKQDDGAAPAPDAEPSGGPLPPAGGTGAAAGGDHVARDGRNRYIRAASDAGGEDAGRQPDDADTEEDGDGRGEDRSGDEGASFNPWEYAPYPDGWLSAFYQTCMRVMLAASRFFADIRPAPVMRSLAFYLVVCVVQILVERVWGMLFLSYFAPNASTDPQMQKVVELLSTQGNLALTLLLRCGFLTLQLYLFSGLLTFIWRFIAPGRAEFSVVFQVLAYAEAPGILCLVPAVGTVAGIIWGLVVMFVGCKAAMRLTWGQTIMGFAPLILLILPSLMQLSQMFMPG